MKKHEKHSTLISIQKRIFRTQLTLIITLALFLGIAGMLINIQFENKKRDQNLHSIADSIAHSLILTEDKTEMTISDTQWEYLDFLRDTMNDIDVISIVNADNIRLYHSNPDLIGTAYDGTLPEFFINSDGYYVTNDSGPSGTQRRAYAAVYDQDGTYLGFVMTVTLMTQIWQDAVQILFIFSLITFAAVFIELILSAYLSDSIKKDLQGYEPDVFSAMYRIRDNIIESLEEGIIAADNHGTIQFINQAASSMLGNSVRNLNEFDLKNYNILLNKIPIREENQVVGTVMILRNREEYTKLMEDLAGTRYLVDSMRASNHDFTNKLHVILGLIQMEMYDEAVSYIQNITIVQREMISKIIRAIDEPAVAALLIGKIARSAELNVKFTLRDASNYSKSDMHLSPETLVTIIGNLIDNAFESMNELDYDAPKELLFGIYSRPGAILITADDTGCGILPEHTDKIFENGFTTKGEGHGTGLFQVKNMVEQLGGQITVESQIDIGTSFSVSISDKNSSGGNDYV